MSAAKTLGLVGRKAGMTRVFTDAGETVPVTVIEALPNRITQVRTVETDGYRALQVAFGDRKASHLNKPQTGHYAKVKVAPGAVAGRVPPVRRGRQGSAAGGELKVDLFTAGQVVDVTGTTTGKGFAGVMKRHNFGGLPASHGVSVSHRSPGSIGQRQTPGRVFPGKRMSGHMGNAAAHDREPQDRARRCRAQSAAGQRRGAGCTGRPGDRASVGEGGGPRSASKKLAPVKK